MIFTVVCNFKYNYIIVQIGNIVLESGLTPSKPDKENKKNKNLKTHKLTLSFQNKMYLC